MKTAKARVFTFDLECPNCKELIASPAGDGSLTWAIHETAPETVKCHECGETVKVPKKVSGDGINIRSEK